MGPGPDLFSSQPLPKYSACAIVAMDIDLIHWALCGQFCSMGSIVRFHTNSCCDHRPWSWGQEAEDAIRKVLKLRYSLMPTLVAAGRRASEDGTPVVQRLDLTWPELADQGANRDDQYLFADGAMLVAPIIPFNGSDPIARNPSNGTANSSRLVWVPPGSWVNGWASASVVTGPKYIEVTDCPFDQIPMWHKKGSLVLTTEPGRAASEQTWTELAIELFPFALQPEPSHHREMINTDAGGERALPLRRWESTLHDTKAVGGGVVDNATNAGVKVPRTALVLEQHPTGGESTLTVTNGDGARPRRWRLRLHLLPGEGIEALSVTRRRSHLHLHPTRKAPPQLLELITQPDGNQLSSHALVMTMQNPTPLSQADAAADGDGSSGVVGRMVEAVFDDDYATPGEELTFSFEVIEIA
jgi:hypothetical protein